MKNNNNEIATVYKSLLLYPNDTNAQTQMMKPIKFNFLYSLIGF